MMDLAGVGVLRRLCLKGERARVSAFTGTGQTMSCRVDVRQNRSCTMSGEPPRANNAERRWVWIVGGTAIMSVSIRVK